MIEEFVSRNAQWIEKHRTKALATPPPHPRRYLPGETFPYLGFSYPLEIVAGQKESLRLDGTFKLSASCQGDAASAFERWYRQQAMQVLSARVEFFTFRYKFQYKGIRVTSARTRWGSCSPTGALSFSWRLLQAPVAVVDYVVVHELVHTAVHNHSKEFWQRVGTILPDYQEHRRWLRELGQQLLT
jgi:predicted metal-dependent hydrolase